MQDMQDQAAGWYRDPGRPKMHRYWNGHSWVGPEVAKSQLPRQAASRRRDEQPRATIDLSNLGLADPVQDT